MADPNVYLMRVAAAKKQREEKRRRDLELEEEEKKKREAKKLRLEGPAKPANMEAEKEKLPKPMTTDEIYLTYHDILELFNKQNAYPIIIMGSYVLETSKEANSKRKPRSNTQQSSNTVVEVEFGNKELDSYAVRVIKESVLQELHTKSLKLKKDILSNQKPICAVSQGFMADLDTKISLFQRLLFQKQNL